MVFFVALGMIFQICTLITLVVQIALGNCIQSQKWEIKRFLNGDTYRYIGNYCI